MVLVSALGILFAVALVIILSYKGVSSLIGGPIAALIILLTGGFNFSYFSDTYAAAIWM